MEGPDGNTIVARADGQLDRGTAIGRYTILALVGQGGMGEVYAAYDPELDRKVALKLLRTDGTGDATHGQARLLREAKAMAKVSHPNVVAVHDAGTFGERVFVAMEFVDGLTLRDWLKEKPRTPDEIVGVFVRAAHGLMAAHAAGLVHRDFKPANVMIGRDGGVRVTDFGIARSLRDAGAESGADPLTIAANLQTTLTTTGQMVGTPRYMAPEQFLAEPADARTDQFSFCVALYEALYGSAPFGQDALLPLMTEVLIGRVQPAPPKSAVPAWLRRVLLRGLRVERDARWPSMKALVTALAHDPGRTRRRRALVVGVSLLVVLPAIWVARQSGHSASLCRGGTTRLAGAWELQGAGAHPRRDAVQRALLASGVPGAKEVWDRVAALLDRYAGGWLAMYQDACLATHVRGEQSAHALDLRMSCLDDRRTALAALTDVLAGADREVVVKGIDAANALPALERCGNVKELESPIEPPRDDETRRKVADIRRRLAGAKALNDTGKHVEAQAIDRRVIADARALGYQPALAEALEGYASSFAGAVEKADTVLLAEEAISTALGVGRDDLAARAAIDRAGISYQFAADVRECRFWLQLAHALLQRAGGAQDLFQSWLLQTEALIHMRENDFQGALALVRQSVALKEKILPKLHPDIAISRNSEADNLHALGRNEEALRVNQQAHDMFAAAYGRASVEAAYTLSNRGDYLLDVARPAEALAAYRGALSGWEAHIGPEHQHLGFPLTGMGRALIALGRPKEAIAPLDRALRLRDPSHTDPGLVGETQFALAQAFAGAGTDEARARKLATSARDAYVRAADKARVAAIDQWLERR